MDENFLDFKGQLLKIQSKMFTSASSSHNGNPIALSVFAAPAAPPRIPAINIPLVLWEEHQLNLI